MASFQVKIGWKRQRKRENKNYRSVTLLPDGLEKIPKRQQKNSKNLKIPLWLLFKLKQVGKGREREKIKIIVPFRFHPTVQRKFQKNNKKIRKIKIYHYGIISSQNRLKRLRKRKNKNYRSVTFLHEGLEKISKKQQKNLKIPLWHHFKPKQVGKG